MIGLVPQLLGVAPEKAIKLTVSHCVRKRIDTQAEFHELIPSLPSFGWSLYVILHPYHTCT